MKKKVFRQLFLLKKHVSHNFTLINAEKTQKKISTPFFKSFYKFWSPYRVKAEKTQEHFSTTFSKHVYKFGSSYRVKAEKTQKHFSTPFFKNFYEFWSPYRVKTSIFEKNFSDNFFYSKNLFHTISHRLKPKKRKKSFNTFFSKIFASSDPHMR